MIDVTAKMKSFIAAKAGWRPEQGKELAQVLARQFGDGLDWDEDAGEDWARVLEGEKVTVLVCMTGPMAIVIGDAASRVFVDTGDADALVVIYVPEFDAVVLHCDAIVLRDAFGDRVWDNPALDTDAFSASELWFCTV